MEEGEVSPRCRKSYKEGDMSETSHLPEISSSFLLASDIDIDQDQSPVSVTLSNLPPKVPFVQTASPESQTSLNGSPFVRRHKQTAGDGKKKNLVVKGKLKNKIRANNIKDRKEAEYDLPGNESPEKISNTKPTAQKESSKISRRLPRRSSSSGTDSNTSKTGSEPPANRKQGRPFRTTISGNGTGSRDEPAKSTTDFDTLFCFDLEERGSLPSLDACLPPTMPDKSNSLRFLPRAGSRAPSSKPVMRSGMASKRFPRKGNHSPVQPNSTSLFDSLPYTNPDFFSPNGEFSETADSREGLSNRSMQNSKVKGSPKRPLQINFRRKTEKQPPGSQPVPQEPIAIDTQFIDTDEPQIEETWEVEEDLHFLREQFEVLESRLLESEKELKELMEESIQNKRLFTAEVSRLRHILGTVDQAQELRYHSLLEVFTDNFRNVGTVEARFEQMLGVRHNQMLNSKIGLLRYCILRIFDFAAAIFFWSIQVLVFSYNLFRRPKRITK